MVENPTIYFKGLEVQRNDYEITLHNRSIATKAAVLMKISRKAMISCARNFRVAIAMRANTLVNSA